jgi:hypothetical protein
MKVHEIINEANIGVNASRPGRASNRPKRGHEPKPQYKVKTTQDDSCNEDELDEHIASRKLCLSSKTDSELGASMLASCKSRKLRARSGKKSHKLGKSPKSRTTVGGKKIAGEKYGGPLPSYGSGSSSSKE